MTSAVDPELREETVRVVRVHAYHQCGGELVSTGNGISHFGGTEWEHKCEKCADRVTLLDHNYPYIDYRPAQQEESA